MENEHNGMSMPPDQLERVRKMLEEKGGLRKIKDFKRDKEECRHSEHNPPMGIYLTPGLYEYTCPGCGHVTTFAVHGHDCECKSSNPSKEVHCAESHQKCSKEAPQGIHCRDC